MRSGRDLDVEPLLQRLQPAQRHPKPRIALAGRDGFEQLVRRATIIEEFDIEVLLLEEAIVDRDRNRSQADGARIPGETQLAGRTGQRRRLGRSPADRELEKVDWRRGTKRQRLRAQGSERSGRCGSRAGLQQAPTINCRQTMISFSAHRQLPSAAMAPPVTQHVALRASGKRVGWIKCSRLLAAENPEISGTSHLCRAQGGEHLVLVDHSELMFGRERQEFFFLPKCLRPEIRRIAIRRQASPAKMELKEIFQLLPAGVFSVFLLPFADRLRRPHLLIFVGGVNQHHSRNINWIQTGVNPHVGPDGSRRVTASATRPTAAAAQKATTTPS